MGDSFLRRRAYRRVTSPFLSRHTTRLQLLKLLQAHPYLSQRELADKICAAIPGGRGAERSHGLVYRRTSAEDLMWSFK